MDFKVVDDGLCVRRQVYGYLYGRWGGQFVQVKEDLIVSGF
jgi:hypothetical protein